MRLKFLSLVLVLKMHVNYQSEISCGNAPGPGLLDSWLLQVGRGESKGLFFGKFSNDIINKS